MREERQRRGEKEKDGVGKEMRLKGKGGRRERRGGRKESRGRNEESQQRQQLRLTGKERDKWMGENLG